MKLASLQTPALLRLCLQVALACLALAPGRGLAQMPEGPGGGLEQARPWLGVAIEKGAHGVLVKDVLKGTPAQDAQIAAGDEITAVNGTAVTKPEELIAAVQAQGVGNTVEVHWLRAGAKMAHAVKLVARPDQLAVLQEQLVGKPVPPFSLKVIQGNGPGSSDQLKASGKVAVVEFWATWCPACRSTHERLSQWATAHKDKAVVLAISDEEDAEIRAYGKAHNPSFTLLADSSHKTASAWMISAIPELAVVGKDGKVTFATIGAGSSLEETLAAAEAAIKQ